VTKSYDLYQLERFYAGLLGGDKDWLVEQWHDYIRSLLDESYDYYQQQLEQIEQELREC
jgi:hypothetical protein